MLQWWGVDIAARRLLIAVWFGGCATAGSCPLRCFLPPRRPSATHKAPPSPLQANPKGAAASRSTSPRTPHRSPLPAHCLSRRWRRAASCPIAPPGASSTRPQLSPGSPPTCASGRRRCSAPSWQVRLLPVVALALTTLPGLEGSRSRVTLSNGASSGGGTPDIHRMVQLRPKHCMPCALGRRYGI